MVGDPAKLPSASLSFLATPTGSRRFHDSSSHPASPLADPDTRHPPRCRLHLDPTLPNPLPPTLPNPIPHTPPLLRPITFPTPILRSLRFHQHVPPTTNTTNPNTHGNPIYNPGPVGGPVLTGGGECHVPWHGLHDHVFSPAPGLHLDLNSPSSSVQSNQLHSCCQPVYPCLCDREGLGPTNTVGPGIQVLAPPPGGRVPCYCLGLVEIVWGGEGGGP